MRLACVAVLNQSEQQSVNASWCLNSCFTKRDSPDNLWRMAATCFVRTSLSWPPNSREAGSTTWGIRAPRNTNTWSWCFYRWTFWKAPDIKTLNVSFWMLSIEFLSLVLMLFRLTRTEIMASLPFLISLTFSSARFSGSSARPSGSNGPPVVTEK